MTGFCQQEIVLDLENINIQLKSVNHRFRDVKIKIPGRYSTLEFKIRKLIEKNFARGSFDLYFHCQKRTDKIQEVHLDYPKIDLYIKKMQSFLNEKNVSLQINASDFLRDEFYEQTNKNILVEDEEKILEGVEKAIQLLKESRLDEGKKLKKNLQDYWQSYTSSLDVIQEEASEYRQALTDKIQSRLKEFLSESDVDKGRFLQEIVYYLEKLDITEEIDRIKIHLSKLQKTLDGQGESGRKIEFLIQELGRETNTIGSKSGSSKISEQAVVMKVNLEKMREQALNIE